MTKKIPPRVREQAASICDASAVWWAGPVGLQHTYPLSGLEGEEFEIACRAVGESNEQIDLNTSREDFRAAKSKLWSNAATLLRTGWEP